MADSIKVRLTEYEQRLIDRMARAQGVSRPDILRMGLRRIAEAMKKNGWEIDFAEPRAEDAEDDGKKKR